MKIDKIIKIIILVLVGAVGFWLVNGGFGIEKKMMDKNEGVINQEIMDKEMTEKEIPSEDIMMKKEGKTISLESTDPRGGTSTATRMSTETFKHTVLADVSDPKEGKFYEGWLVKKNLGVVTGFYSTGKMEKNTDGKYELNYTAVIDEKSEYNEVVITEETSANGLDGKPEGHIFEGKFEN